MVSEYAVKKGLWFDVDGEILVGEDTSSAWRKTVNSAWSEHDVLTGTAKGDMLFGESGNDWLVGLDGGDVLYGGKGNDRLEGDAGDDHYMFYTGEGFDRIDDTDGQGTLHWDDQTLTGGRWKAGPTGIGGIYESADHRFQFVHAQNGKLYIVQSDLTDPNAGIADALIVLNYAPGQLGINLDNTRPVFSFLNFFIGDAQGAVVNDSFRGTAGSDQMQGFAGQDVLIGNAGDDELLGGDGDDELRGDDRDGYMDEIGDDRLDGGAGDDVLYGGRGNDMLEGGEGSDRPNAGAELTDYLHAEIGCLKRAA